LEQENEEDEATEAVPEQEEPIFQVDEEMSESEVTTNRWKE
jgi:hypothetical protein